MPGKSINVSSMDAKNHSHNPNDESPPPSLHLPNENPQVNPPQPKIAHRQPCRNAVSSTNNPTQDESPSTVNPTTTQPPNPRTTTTINPRPPHSNVPAPPPPTTPSSETTSTHPQTPSSCNIHVPQLQPDVPPHDHHHELPKVRRLHCSTQFTGRGRTM